MNDYFENIKNRRTELGLSQEELAEKMGYRDRSAIAKIEAGKVDIPQSKIEAFAKALNTTPAHLMGWVREVELEGTVEMGLKMSGDFIIERRKQGLKGLETKKIPLLGTIAAGEPIFADEDFNYYVECGAEIKADFALRVKGDSMINARIHDGDIVFVRKQPTVNQGEIAVVLIDDEATLKRFRQYGNHVVLQAENPAFSDIEFELGEDVNIRILGKAVAFQSDVK
ncbi:MAG: transcriptional repressor LexA [Oscillospiraceae bacterium]|nr:transcriptional repressor LexA [Oscillospiraceae bacterium]